ncbi:MAG: molybdopterin-dependent oxidoreductase [Xanthobacteraceae bacterium]|nr:molybdopterin-dependent oxidoreductase [Xanthobacteraceae bacterium]MCW5676376.1 molybdopterin-dependent oxidoreductase [Xanthobacteraceae bacterium]
MVSLQKTEIAGYCTLCRSRCGTINTIENGRLTEVRNDPQHPTGKATCLKGRAAPEIAHSARRLTTPLRRTAPKGSSDPKFVPISWEEALSTVADRLSKIKSESGPESIAFGVTSPSSSSISDAHEWIWRFIRKFGSPNTVYATELCNWHKDFAHAFTFGCGTPTADYRNSDLILLWGHNPSNVWLAQAEAITAAKARGAKLVIIDPRKTAMTATADIWLPVRPGTDGALAMGVAHEMIARGLINKEFVRRHTNASFLVREDNGEFLRVRDVGGISEPDDYLAWNDEVERAVTLNEADDSFFSNRGIRNVPTPNGPIACRTAFEKFVDALSSYDAAAVGEICGVNSEDVVSLAQMMGKANAIAYHAWTGVGQHTNATQTERSIATLYALTDSFDKPGGNVRHAAHPVPKLHDISMIPANVRSKTLGLEDRPLGPPAEGWITGSDFYDAVLDRKPYQVRGLFCFGANLLVSQPNSERGLEALKALEFYVHCDIFMNPTAALADIVLPVSVPWENEAMRVGFEISHEAQEHIQFRPKMISRLGETKSDTEIVFDLATRLGLGSEFFDGDIEAGYNFILSSLGLTVKHLKSMGAGGTRRALKREFQKYKTSGFSTETKRAELYSEKLLRHGYSPVPQYVAASAESKKFPILMFSVNNGYFCHSQHRALKSLRSRRPDPIAMIHPSTASQYSIADGDWINVTTATGEFQVRAAVSETVGKGMLASDYGWWEPANDLGLSNIGMSQLGKISTYNRAVADTLRDPISGSLPLRSTRCSLQKIITGAWRGSKSFKVKEKRKLTEDTVSLTLAAADNEMLPTFLPGQYVSFEVAGRKRSYSLTSPSNRRLDTYSIAVRRVENGEVSAVVFDQLNVGDTVNFGTPSGSFIIPTLNEFPVVMIAGGIGITPFISYMNSLSHLASGAPPRIALLYYCRDPKSIAFRDELNEFAKSNHCLDIRLFIENGEPIAFGNGTSGSGRFSITHIDDGLFSARARFYICGVGAMIKVVTDELRARGVPKFEIFSERFVSPPASAPTDLVPRDVTFARSGKTLTWTPAEGSLLSLAEKSGLSLPSGCRVGQCESCATRVVEGTVRHAIDVELEEEGTCLTCVGVPVTNVVLDA